MGLWHVAPELIRRWSHYVGEHGETMRALASEHGWPVDLGRVTEVAKALYRRAGDGTATWAGPGKVALLDEAGRAEKEDALPAVN